MTFSLRRWHRLLPLVATLALVFLPFSALSSTPPHNEQPVQHDFRSLARVAADGVASFQVSTGKPGLRGWNNTGCMARFETHRHEFEEKCTDNVCYLFLQEAPYIILDPTMTSVEEQILFPCGKPPERFRRLRGAAFKIMESTPARNATCAFAGPSCSFNHLVQFVRFQGLNKTKFQFAITGLLLEFPDRLDAHIIPGISLLQEEMVIIGERSAANEDLFPVKRLVRPFQDNAWGLFTALTILFVLYAVAMAAVFGPRPVSLHGLVHFYIGDYSEADIAANTAAPQTLDEVEPGVSTVFAGALTRLASLGRPEVAQELDSSDDTDPIGDLEEADEQLHEAYVSRVVSRLANYRVARRLLQVALSATVIVFMIFYEIAVVNVLFIERSKPSEKSVDKLSDKRLESYSVQMNAATETVFRDAVDPKGKRPWYHNETAYPWGRCVTERECFKWLVDPKHPVKLFVGFKTIGTYELVARNACKNFTIFNPEKSLYTFGAGWLYGSTVPESYRHSMDRAILNLQISETIHEIIQGSIGKLDSAKCNPKINDIGVGIIGVSLFFFVAPFLGMVLLLVLWQCFKRSRADMAIGSARGRGARPFAEGGRMSQKDIDLHCKLQSRRRIRAMPRPRGRGRRRRLRV